MMPTTLELNLQAGQYRADRDRLIRLVLAVAAGLEDGTAPTHWRNLLRAARWMRARDDLRTLGTLNHDGRGDHDGTP